MGSNNQWASAAASMITASAVIMLAGCAGASHPPPAAIPRPGPTQAAGPTQAVGPILPVDKPRDITPMTQRPCDLLTPAQATGFQLDLPADQLTGLRGTLRCKWTTTTGSQVEIVRMLDVSLSVNTPAFDVAYNQYRGLPLFDVTTIAGDPAIVAMANPKLPICMVKLKVADQQSISVDYEDKALNKNPQQSCEVGKRVAAAVLTNVPPKS